MGRGKRQDYFNKINYLKKRLIGEVKAKMRFYKNIVESIFLILVLPRRQFPSHSWLLYINAPLAIDVTVDELFS